MDEIKKQLEYDHVKDLYEEVCVFRNLTKKMKQRKLRRYIVELREMIEERDYIRENHLDGFVNPNIGHVADIIEAFEDIIDNGRQSMYC